MVFFLSPTTLAEKTLHTFDVQRALLFYLNGTQGFRKHRNLFICFKDQKKGQAASAQTLSRWLVTTIKLSYRQASIACPLHIQVHSTRSQASSATFSVKLSQRCLQGSHVVYTFHLHKALLDGRLCQEGGCCGESGVTVNIPMIQPTLSSTVSELAVLPCWTVQRP